MIKLNYLTFSERCPLVGANEIALFSFGAFYAI